MCVNVSDSAAKTILQYIIHYHSVVIDAFECQIVFACVVKVCCGRYLEKSHPAHAMPMANSFSWLYLPEPMLRLV